MSTSSPRNWVYLAPKPKSNYRQLVIKDRGIRARTLYGMYVSEEEPMTIEEIAVEYNLPVEAVMEAIAYCESKPPEIEEDFRRDEALMEATGMNDPLYKYHGKPHVLSPQERARLDEP
jgi:uncharacterized protein (DUF433 family)